MGNKSPSPKPPTNAEDRQQRYHDALEESTTVTTLLQLIQQLQRIPSSEPLCAATDREEVDQQVKLDVMLTPSSLIKEDDSNPTYVLHIGKWRCEVKKCSTLHFVAVRSKDNDWSKFPPHCGLMLKNKFYLQERAGDQKHEFDYLLAHALLMDKDSASTKLILSFCNSQKMVFTELCSVHKAYQQATESISPGVTSSTPCNQLVKLIKEELAKPFDPNWNKHLEGAARPSDSVTNCALLAGRVFRDLMPSSERDDSFDNIQLAFSQLGLKDLASTYRSDFEK